MSAAANRPPEPGTHHVAGVYDGRTVRLFIDGELVQEREASGGLISACDAPVAVGHLSGGNTAFSGAIGGVRVSPVARGAGWLAARARNVRAPGEFCRIAD